MLSQLALDREIFELSDEGDIETETANSFAENDKFYVVLLKIDLYLSSSFASINFIHS